MDHSTLGIKLQSELQRTEEVMKDCFEMLLECGWEEIIKKISGNSLVVQWLRIRLPMQGTRVQALVWEDLTCRRAIKPVCHSYWACTLGPASHNYWVNGPQLLKPVRLEPCAPQQEKPLKWETHTPQWRVASALCN